MKLWAISDLHVGYPENRAAVQSLPWLPDDWLILAGDVGETAAHLRWVFDTLGPRFRQLVWVPGNHELWTVPHEEVLRGVAKYEALVAVCREYRVLTPEDPYALFEDGTYKYCLAPLFSLYDYSFCPEGLNPAQARAWALASGVDSVDTYLLHADPYDSVEQWCEARCVATEKRLSESTEDRLCRTVLVNHYPLRADMARLPRVPRMSIWCGTQRTRDWHRRFQASVVVSGHLHIPRTQEVDGVRFEEVSLGYPRQWRRSSECRPALRQILPGPSPSKLRPLESCLSACVD